MSPVIRLDDDVYNQLQGIAEPFVDTPSSVVRRLIDFFKTHNAINDAAGSPATPETMKKRFRAETPPDLKHTRLLRGVVGDHTAHKWNDLVICAHLAAIDSTGSKDKVFKITKSNLASVTRDDSGYHPDNRLGASIQYVDSNKAFQHALHLAQLTKVPFKVEVEWRSVDGAEYPGERAIIEL